MAEVAEQWPLTYQRTAGPLPVEVVFDDRSGHESVAPDFVVNAASSPCSSSCASFVLPARSTTRSAGTPPAAALLPPAAAVAARSRHRPDYLFFVSPMPEDSSSGAAAQLTGCDSPTTQSVVLPTQPLSPQQALLPLWAVPMWAPPEGAGGGGGGGSLLGEWPAEVEGERCNSDLFKCGSFALGLAGAPQSCTICTSECVHKAETNN
jgi:hypothetical protein